MAQSINELPRLYVLNYIEINGIYIRYRTVGEGEQVFLLHGWGGSIENMELLFNDLSKYYAVTIVDLPGHGKSGLPLESWGVIDFIDCILEIMKRLNIQRPHLIGHSFGGRIAIKLAALYPDRIGKIILVNSAGIRLPHSVSYYLKFGIGKIGKFIAKFGGKFGEICRNKIYNRISSPDYRNAGPLRGTFLKIINEDLRPFLPKITSPTLLVWGENDTETPLASAYIMKKHIPNAKLIIFKSAGHFLHIDQHLKFCLVINKFLREY